jgi:hypothetical protein
LVANVRKRYELNKKLAEKFGMEIFNFRKLNELEVKRLYQIKISERFAALGTLSDSEEIKMVWGKIKENIKLPAK